MLCLTNPQTKYIPKPPKPHKSATYEHYIASSVNNLNIIKKTMCRGMYPPNLYYPSQRVVSRSICVHCEHAIIREYAEKIKISAGNRITAVVVRLAKTKECVGGTLNANEHVLAKNTQLK